MGLLSPSAGACWSMVTSRCDACSGMAPQHRVRPQDGFLFHDTIRRNMLWACPSAPMPTSGQPRTAAASTFVDRLPDGLDTVRGRSRRQAVGRRAPAPGPCAGAAPQPSLILDEATSALDSADERQILEAVASLRGQLTILLITHRLSTVRQADAIHVLSGGRIVESGTWVELSARDGAFRALWRTQDSHPMPWSDTLAVRAPGAAEVLDGRGRAPSPFSSSPDGLSPSPCTPAWW